MSDDLDLFRSASVLIRHFGVDAAKERARLREKELLDVGDVVGAAAWRGIYSAIEDLSVLRPEGARIH